MPIIRLDLDNPDSTVIQSAAKFLRAGGLVAFPTETVYGLGANGLDSIAVQKIFEAKGRPSYNPLILHVEGAEAAQGIVEVWPETAAKLAEQFWPGPLTFVLPKQPAVPDSVTAGLPTVAVRAPAHAIAQALLRETGLPIAAPSANKFTQLSPTHAAHVAKAFGDDLLILDGGPCHIGIESTVLDLSTDTPILLRAGGISREQIETVIGAVALPATLPQNDSPRPAPGMIERHYAPRARLLVMPGNELAARAEQAMSEGEKTGVVALTQQNVSADKVIALPDEAAAYAREIYAALHSLDDAGCDVILVEKLPDSPEWLGLHDRLKRASKQ